MDAKSSSNNPKCYAEPLESDKPPVRQRIGRFAESRRRMTHQYEYMPHLSDAWSNITAFWHSLISADSRILRSMS